MKKKKRYNISKRNKKIQESLIMQFIRKWSYQLTRVLIRTPITPNQVTILGFFFAIIGAVLFSFNEYVFTILGGTFAWFTMVLDCVDGEIARIKNLQSKYGRWLDATVNRTSEVILFIGISIGVYKQYPSVYTLLLCLLATSSTTLWRHLSLQKIVIFNLPVEKKKPYKPIGFDVGMQYFIIVIGALSNQLLLVLIFFAIMVNFAWIKNMLITIRSY